MVYMFEHAIYDPAYLWCYELYFYLSLLPHFWYRGFGGDGAYSSFGKGSTQLCGARGLLRYFDIVTLELGMGEIPVVF